MTSAAKVLPQGILSVDIDSHRADLARRQAERDAKAPELFRCLDSLYARECENRKPQYRFKVVAEWTVPSASNATPRGYMVDDDEDEDAGRMTTKKAERTVVAQHADDAWALFSDAVGGLPGPRSPGLKRKITRGKLVDPVKVLAMKNSRQ